MEGETDELVVALLFGVMGINSFRPRKAGCKLALRRCPPITNHLRIQISNFTFHASRFTFRASRFKNLQSP
jgi:hypothetical protein